MSHTAHVGIQQFPRRLFFYPRTIRFATLVWGVVLLLGLFALGPPGRLHAQQPDSLNRTQQMYRVETTKGEVVIGPLRSKNDTEVVLESRQCGETWSASSDTRGWV